MKSIVFALTTILSFSALSAIDLLTINTTKFVDLDINKIHDEDVLNEKLGNAPRFAIEKQVNIDAYENGWEKVGSHYVSRHRIIATNAVSLNFAFDFKMSQNSKVKIYATNFSDSIRTLTKKDNNPDGKYWTPIIESDDVIVELSVPENEMAQFKFKIIQVNQGYRKFGQRTSKSGSCNIDVVCNESQGWEAEVNSVAVISTGGSTFCTGFMVNNTENDKSPLFMTAKHCRIRSSNASSLVAYWNYQTSQCAGSRDGKKKQFSSGAQFLSASTKSDFTLVKFNRRPNSSWNVSYAGWDRTGMDALQATAIHHPSTDEKSISFEYQPTTVTSYLGEQIPGDATHVRVEDWDVGTTEPGSSGSPLFDQNHRVIGQLHGGYASCTSQTSDWYGRIYTSWEGDGSADTRLKDWLDPNDTGKTFVDTL